MLSKNVLQQLLDQNKTKFFRIDFTPDAFWTDDKPTKLVGIKRNVNHVNMTMFNILDRKEYVVSLQDISKVNLRKFKLQLSA